MKKLGAKKFAVGVMILGSAMAVMGLLASLSTLFKLYDRMDDADCQAGGGCDIEAAASTLPLSEGLMYSGTGLVIIGVLLLIYALRQKQPKVK